MFDLDGTLVNTRLAVTLAYKSVGVLMPPHAWGLPASQWLGDIQAHEAKKRVYPQFLEKYGKTLPLFSFAQRHQCPVITGASLEAVQAITRAFGTLNVQLTGASSWDKTAFLMSLGDGEYIDDDNAYRQYLSRTLKEWNTWDPVELSPLFLQQVETNG